MYVSSFRPYFGLFPSAVGEILLRLESQVWLWPFLLDRGLLLPTPPADNLLPPEGGKYAVRLKKQVA